MILRCCFHYFLDKLFFIYIQGIDVKSMGRIFIGLVKCGAWGCFDEFNRLEEAVLSAVSMQIQSIQAAIKNKHPNIELLGRNVSCNEISLCMDPAVTRGQRVHGLPLFS